MSIFISYRREDSADIAGRIDDRLRDRFGQAAVFRDVDNIPPGVDFVSYLTAEVDKCRVLLAIVGPEWDVDRLREATDFVRVETEAALARGIPVIPVLVGDADLPGESALPESLRPLRRRQAVTIRSGRGFEDDVAYLIEGIQTHLRATAPPKAAQVPRPAAPVSAPPRRAGAGGVFLTVAWLVMALFLWLPAGFVAEGVINDGNVGAACMSVVVMLAGAVLLVLQRRRLNVFMALCYVVGFSVAAVVAVAFGFYLVT